MPSNMEVIEQATSQLSSEDPIRRLAGFHVLSVANAAKVSGIELRWPSPPFDGTHIELVDNEWRFQLSWTLKFLNERAELFEDERRQITIPPYPFTEEAVQSFVAQMRKALNARSIFARFKRPASLSTEEELLRTRCIQILRGNWTTSQILGQAAWQLVCVPRGQYLQGNDSSVFENEQPAHLCEVDSFWIGGTPVTEQLWSVVMGEDPMRASADHAKVGVSWLDALKFCNALSRRCGLDEVYVIPSTETLNPEDVIFDYERNGYRLPSEKEWEYAARGTQRGLNQMPKGVDVEHMSDFPLSANDISPSAFSGSEILKEVGWFVDNSRNKLPIQAQKRPNSFGLYDMSGNVREWCMDGFGRYHDWDNSSVVQAHSAQNRVCRGGAYSLRSELCRVSSRVSFGFNQTNSITGFRVARTQ
ncbi:MAG: SUMF1/EgtB/PvdO family nonheme iron enzyme [Myxococcota bacterium]|nr:SUMF1/EgtB/PvdO family nonheme iron enzyme [Myxococcota bacterium]